jgi:hypothetical protein
VRYGPAIPVAAEAEGSKERLMERVRAAVGVGLAEIDPRRGRAQDSAEARAGSPASSLR